MATTMEGNFQFGLDVHFAQRLAGNFTKIRERTVKKLKRWIAARSLKQGGEGMEAELLRLWKGLFYCMWMCDKPVVQEELADRIADLIHSFATPQGAMMFFDAFLLTMKREWVGIDRLRMDKYFMFIRRCFRQVLVVLKKSDWNESVVDQFLAVLCKTPLSTDPEASPDGLRYHFIDIYRDELERCTGEELTSDQVLKLIDPFCVLVTTTQNKTLLKVILRGFFQEIVEESDIGFPDESEDEGIDSEEDREEDIKKKDEDEEDEDEVEEMVEEKRKFEWKERAKLKYNYEAIADRLFTLASQQSTPGYVRRKVYAIVKKFRDLKQGVFPDYNIASLVDYQEDDDEDDRKYGKRLPREKPKKSRRRGGKQARECRRAKAELRAAREAKTGSEDDAEEVDDDDFDDDEAREELKKKKRRKKKQTSGVNGEMEKAKWTDASFQKEEVSVTEDKQNGPGEKAASLKQQSGEKMDKAVAKKPVQEKEVVNTKSSPGSTETDRGSGVQKRGKKRKSEGNKISVATPVTDDGNNQKTSDATADANLEIDEEGKIDKLEEVHSSDAGSETKNGGKQKGKAKKKKSNIGGTEAINVASSGGDLVSSPDRDGTRKSKEIFTQELQTNLFKVDKEPTVHLSASDLKVGKGSATNSDTPVQLDGDDNIQASKGGKRKKEQPFAAFQAVSTPPAFVRRKVIRKEGEAQTEPPRKKKSRLSQVTDHTTPRKRVKIALGLNKAHGSKDYEKQLESSPGIPFDGSKKPIQSVLKTPSPKPRPPSQGKNTTFKTPTSKMTPPTGQKTDTPILKTPSPKVIKETGVKSNSKKGKSPGTAPNLRRSTRINKF